MPKHVVDVGNCVPDHAAIRRLVEANFDARVTRAHGLEDAQALLARGDVHLVLVNRKLDRDYSDGLAIIRRLKSDPQTAHVPVMMITNYPEHQQLAVEAGAEPGFGKAALSDPATLKTLRRVL